MNFYATYHDEDYPDPWESADVMIVYESKERFYAMPLRDGGSSFILISHCPFCGTNLAHSPYYEE